MPHERKINHDLSSLTKFLLVQYQLKWFVSSVTREVFWATFEGSLIFKGNGPDVFWWRSWSYVFVFFFMIISMFASCDGEEGCSLVEMELIKYFLFFLLIKLYICLFQLLERKGALRWRLRS